MASCPIASCGWDKAKECRLSLTCNVACLSRHYYQATPAMQSLFSILTFSVFTCLICALYLPRFKFDMTQHAKTSLRPPLLLLHHHSFSLLFTRHLCIWLLELFRVCARSLRGCTLRARSSLVPCLGTLRSRVLHPSTNSLLRSPVSAQLPLLLPSLLRPRLSTALLLRPRLVSLRCIET